MSLLLLMLISFACNPGSGKNQNQVLIQVPIVELQPMSITLPKTYVSDIQAVQFVEVRAKVEGFVDRIYVDEGQFVKKGQNLFQLTSNEYNEMVNSANARLFQARAEAQAAQLEVDRLKVLVDKNIIARSEYQLALSKKAVAESAISEAESMLKNAKTGLSYTTIKAPFDGIVDRIPYKTGSLVTAGDLLTNITDISEIFAYYKVTENEYLQYMRAKIENETLDDQEVSLILSDGVYYENKGRLETMEADFERGTGSIAFRVRFPNPDQLIKHGSTGKVEMSETLEDIFLIPQKSTFEIQDYNYVYIVDKNNKVRVRSFKPLQRFGVFYIADGFEPGDRIIFEGIQQVKDGMEIMPELTPEKDVYDTLVKS
ncbi:efflux RND transporter periplasmic adaptor subunit [Cecembia lonarensis]|uniref:Putative efflux pump periplasmic linker ttgA n=1 Tax=Cecembia lonarensis (strain CCUG 58316 / KCTC 22772 / LW9) TaxID=1225176 RepID=K1M284_CECL9|nr:efflux RND transporter periplasmic adaptor subunit [Cecembia lonarensis]EKB50384.1 putative efflux pump periplasmic linker ttgA precursor [Cecembia lonarensis LW9]